MTAQWGPEEQDDAAFWWVAAGQLLLALGVREESVRRVGELRPPSARCAASSRC